MRLKIHTLYQNMRKNQNRPEYSMRINSNRILETPNFRGIPGKRYKFGVFN